MLPGMRPSLRRALVVDAALALALAGAVWTLHAPVLGLWWTHDDFFLLRSMLVRRPSWYFVDPSAYREPPSASFRVAGTDLFCDLGPYRAGTYRFLFQDGRQAFDVPRKAGFQLRTVRALPPLRIVHESPEGWVTHHPRSSSTAATTFVWTGPVPGSLG